MLQSINFVPGYHKMLCPTLCNTHTYFCFSWKENVPHMFEDLCLYSQVIEQMSLYNYKLSMRRFIQGFFEPVKFTQVGKLLSNT